MKTIARSSQGEIKIKKSQFVARLFPTSSKDESKRIIENISLKFKDATHNCTAYITSDGEGYDDNGEPAGTAGKPMINVLKKNDLHNITAIVTRYFGGVKLGAGGLVRAYGRAVMEAIENSEIIEVEYYDVYSLEFNYADMKNIENEIRNNNLMVVNKAFSENVEYELVGGRGVDIESVFCKFGDKVFVSFKNKKVIEKIED